MTAAADLAAIREAVVSLGCVTEPPCGDCVACRALAACVRIEADTLTPEEARLFLALLADEPEWNSQPEIRAKLERIAGDTGETT